MLGANAAYLGKLGQRVTGVAELWNFELEQAMGLGGGEGIASSTDLVLAADGLAPFVTRRFDGTVPGRWSDGPFGLGWRTLWESKARVTGGAIELVSANRRIRRFKPDWRSGSFVGAPGDYARIVAAWVAATPSRNRTA